MPELREYQNELLEDIRTAIRNGKRSIACVIGCGGGKSYILSKIIQNATRKGNRVLFLVHCKELLNQIKSTLYEFNVDMNFCDCFMVQTATRKIGEIQEPKIIITDEFHHSTSKSYTNIYNAFPDALRIGFTATPERLDVGGLGEICDCIVQGKSTEWLIENNYLSNYTVYSIKLVETSGIHTKGGDFDRVELSELMENKRIYGDIYTNWVRLAIGKQTIIYCASIKQSKETVETFKNNGVIAYHIDGNTPPDERERLIQGFKEGGITVLSNVDLFGEGLSVDGCYCVCLARPTKSLTLYIQQALRACRYQKGKHAIILDFVGNTIIHGFPSDDREWSLEARKTKQKNEVSILVCPHCYAVSRSMTKECNICGYDFKSENDGILKARKAKEQKEYDLHELERLSTVKIKEADFKTWDEVEKFRKAHKYKLFWAVRKAIAKNIEVPHKIMWSFKKYGGFKI